MDVRFRIRNHHVQSDREQEMGALLSTTRITAAVIAGGLFFGCNVEENQFLKTTQWAYQPSQVEHFAILDQGMLPPAPFDLTFEITYLAASNQMDLHVGGAEPGAEVRLYASYDEGFSCRHNGTACVDLADPVRVLGRKNADAYGDVFVQMQARGDIFLQAVVWGPVWGGGLPLASAVLQLDMDDGVFVEGCTDPNALNYDSDATSDSGDCEYPLDAGCTDPDADNYDPDAVIDDNSCDYLGCTDPNAENYDFGATLDNGLCEYCEDVDADFICDSVDDCIGYIDALDVCNGPCDADLDNDEICDDVDPCVDADHDSICDDVDDCVGSYDALNMCNGFCPLDADNDGVCDVIPEGMEPADLGDLCGEDVTYSAVEDEDGDGVADYYDHCRGTSLADVDSAEILMGASLPAAYTVNELGCIVVQADFVTLGADAEVPVHFGIEHGEATFSRACPSSSVEEIMLVGDAAILSGSGEDAFDLFNAEILLGREAGDPGISRVQGTANFGFLGTDSGAGLGGLAAYNDEQAGDEPDMYNGDNLVEIDAPDGGGLFQVNLGYDYPSNVGAIEELPLNNDSKWLYLQIILNNHIRLSGGEDSGVEVGIPKTTVQIPGMIGFRPIMLVNPALEAVYVGSGPIDLGPAGVFEGAIGLSNYPAFTFEPNVLLPDSVVGEYTYETGESLSYEVDHGNVDANIDPFMGQIYVYVKGTVPIPGTGMDQDADPLLSVTGEGDLVVGLTEDNEGGAVSITELGRSTGFRIGWNATSSINLMAKDEAGIEPLVVVEGVTSTFMYEWQYTDNDMSGTLTQGDDDTMNLYMAAAAGFEPDIMGMGTIPFYPTDSTSASGEFTLENFATALAFDNDIGLGPWEIKVHTTMNSGVGALSEFGIDINDPLNAEGLLVLNSDGVLIEAFLEADVNDLQFGIGSLDVEGSAFAHMFFPFDVDSVDEFIDESVIEIHADFDAGFYLCPLVILEGVGECTYELITDTAVCGLEVAWDAAVCGAEWVTDGLICGYDIVTDAAICGWEQFECGVEWFTTEVGSWWDCIGSAWWCDCWEDWLGISWCDICCEYSAAVWCDTPASCDIDGSCNSLNGEEFESCDISATCEVPSSCEDLGDLDLYCNADNADMWVEVWLGLDVTNGDCLYITGDAGLEFGIDGLFTLEGEVSLDSNCDYLEACVDTTVGEACGTIEY